MEDTPPPIIQIGPSNQTLPRGSTATLVCQATGSPAPKIKWTKDKSPLKESKSSRIHISTSGTLKIDGE